MKSPYRLLIVAALALAACGGVEQPAQPSVPEDGDGSVTGVTLSDEFVPLSIGKSYLVTATVLPADATNQSVRWESSNTNVATVDDSGRVTIRGTGQATITATAAATDSFEEASGSYLLTVNPAPIGVSAEVSGALYYGDPVEPSLAIVRGSLKYDDTIDSLGVNMSTEATAGRVRQ